MINFDQLARVAAETMLNGIVGGTAIALLAGLGLHITGRRNSQTRFALLMAALLAIAGLPVMSVLKRGAGAAQSEGAVWAVHMPAAWASYLAYAWGVIALIGLSRVMIGLWQLHRLRAESRMIDPAEMDPLLQTTLRDCGSREARIAASEKLTVPAAIGFFDPMVILPQWTLRELSPAELNSILIHELAHLKRRDDWTNLAQKVLRAMFFFHPAVWWIERQLSLEREMACDAVVLEQTANPSVYAGCLVTVAERSFMRRGLAMAQAAVSRLRHTTLRVAQILSGERTSSRSAWKPAIAVAALASGALALGLVNSPELVAFRDATPSLTAAALPVAQMTNHISAPLVGKPVLAAFHVKASRKPASVAPRAAQAKLHGAPARAVAPVPTLAVAKEQAAAPQAVLVVMRTTQLGPDGENWTVQVWRFSMLKAGQIPIELIIPSKSL